MENLKLQVVILTSCFMAVATCTLAQNVVIEGNSVTITDGLITAIDGNIINKGNLHNDGEIRITGSWVNQGNYSDGENGEVIFNSEEDQVINHNEQNFEQFTITGGGNKILTESLTINGEINFEEGKLVVAEGSQLVFGPEATLNNASKDSYIIGEVYRQGQDELFFPIGTDNAYLPVTLINVKGTDPLVGFNIHEGQLDYELAKNLRSVSQNWYWEMIPNESYVGSNIVLPLLDETFLFSTDEATIVQATDGVSTYFDIGKSEVSGSPIDGSITSAGLALGRYYAVADFKGEEVLPPIRVINVLTPYADGKHDFMRIENIELYENNKVEVYTRAGELVFSMSNYNNQDRVFRGFSNNGSERALTTGNYYYSILLNKNDVFTGYVYLKQ